MRFTVLILLIGLSSCVTQKKRLKICATCPTEIHDSIVTIIKDTTVYVTQKGDTITLDSPCSELCDNLGNIKEFSRKKRKNGLVTIIKTENNTLVADCQADSLKAVIDSLKTTQKFKVQTVVKTEYKQSKWNGFTHWWFIITSILIGGRLILKYIKF